jgi:hypothetical protein
MALLRNVQVPNCIDKLVEDRRLPPIHKSESQISSHQSDKAYEYISAQCSVIQVQYPQFS